MVKTIIRDFTSAFVLGFAFPWLLLTIAAIRSQTPVLQKPIVSIEEKISKGEGNVVLIYREGNAERTDLDAYLVGVILAEMPADFSEEALKAQAIAARTYSRKAYETGGKHENGSVCLDPGCCQAYLSYQQYLQQGGTAYAVRKVASAVRQTQGTVLVYEDALIEATYFSCSGGKTEDALEVWGTDYPYLQSVDSPGEEEARYHRDVIHCTPETMARRLGIESEEPPEKWITLTEYTEGGSVRKMIIAGHSFTGTQLRSLLQLRSAAFDITIENGQFRITTKGFGHRVGLSQYGAQAMAQAGHSYEEILSHYYPGTKLKRLEPDYTQGICRKLLS